MILSLIILGLLCAVLPTLIGLLTLYHIMRNKRNPADVSNRINHIRLWWFVLTREDKFTDQFPWMCKDEWDNVQ